MRAHPLRLLLLVTSLSSLGASAETENFVVAAPTPEIAETIAVAAEKERIKLSRAWFGDELPVWRTPCRVVVVIQDELPRGSTRYQIRQGRVGGWEIDLAGSLDRVIESVLPHELSHAVLASHFARPIPRWADEGAATLAEADIEQARQHLLAQGFAQSRHRLPLKALLDIREYPRDESAVAAVYGIGFSLSDFLVRAGGRPRFIAFLQQGQDRGWDIAIRESYGFAGIESLESEWLTWALDGMPKPKPLTNGRWVKASPLIPGSGRLPMHPRLVHRADVWTTQTNRTAAYL